MERGLWPGGSSDHLTLLLLLLLLTPGPPLHLSSALANSTRGLVFHASPGVTETLIYHSDSHLMACTRFHTALTLTQTHTRGGGNPGRVCSACCGLLCLLTLGCHSASWRRTLRPRRSCCTPPTWTRDPSLRPSSGGRSRTPRTPPGSTTGKDRQRVWVGLLGDSFKDGTGFQQLSAPYKRVFLNARLYRT